MTNASNYKRLSRACNEYLLVAKPDGAMSATIQQARQQFDDTYGAGLAVKSKPRLTIGSFLATEDMEPTLIAWLQRICGSELSFTLMLNNFSGYPTHTIYLRVQNQQPVLKLIKKLQQIDSYVAGNTGHAVRWNTCPQVTIAQALPETVYATAIANYATKELTAEFVVHELVLMRRTDAQYPAEKVAVISLRPELAPLFLEQQLHLF